MSKSGEKGTKNSGARLTDRDLRILRFIVSHGIATVHHVGRFAFSVGGGEEGFDPASESAVYRRLRKLKRLGLIRHERVLFNQPGIYRATEAGARTAALGLAPARIDLADLEHDMRVVTLSLQLLKSSRFAARWITEREIRHAVLGRTRNTQTGLMHAGKGFGRIPDGLLVGLGGERVAIEAEVSSKRDAAYRKIMDSYATKHRDEIPEGLPHHYLHIEPHLQEYVESGGEVDGVAYYCASDALRKRVAAAQKKTMGQYSGSADLAFWALDLDDPKPLRFHKHETQTREKRENEERWRWEEEERRRREEERRQAERRRAEHEARLRDARQQLTNRERHKALREANRRAGRLPDASVPRNEAELAIISAAGRKRTEQEGRPGVAERLREVFGGQ